VTRPTSPEGQRTQILKRLQAGKKVSALQSLRDFGCMRLAARVFELRERGHEITTTWRKKGSARYAVYRLVIDSDGE
jgi:hypothetical protein